MTVAGDEEPVRPPDDVLDDPIWAALTGPQAGLAVRRPRAARFPPDVAPFAAVSDPADPAAWADLARLVGPAGTVAIAAAPGAVPSAWRLMRHLDTVQMTDDAVSLSSDLAPRTVVLDDGDVPAMLELVRRTDPGPFEARTIDLGGFVGVRIGGQLAAMAGRRMHPPGWVEVTAVCTDPAYRGQGLARRVLTAAIGGIHADGERSFLHVLAANTGAIGLYLDFGFVRRRAVDILVVQAPG